MHQAAWGYHSAVVAVRALLRAGLRDPTNQRFQLLSGATLPLWAPPVVYARLMAEPTSHLDACRIPVSRHLFTTPAAICLKVKRVGRAHLAPGRLPYPGGSPLPAVIEWKWQVTKEAVK